MDLNEISIFIKVVQLGSFSKAAKALDMPNSTVSSKVSSLEARLRVTLIKRTTRRLSVTEAGQVFFERCLHGLEELRHAEDELSMNQTELSGLLRVTAPVELGSVILPAVLADFTKRFPKVSLEFVLTDRSVDMVLEGIDLAIRAGELPDSSLHAKKLGMVYFAPFASKAYLKAEGVPQTPKDLQRHCLLHFPRLGAGGWRLTSGKSTVSVLLEKKIVMNDLNGLKALATAGLGIALLPTFICQTEIRDGALIRILPAWKTDLRPVHFVYPNQKFASPKVRAFIEATEAAMKKTLLHFEV